MTGNVEKRTASQVKAYHPLGQCCHITLSNGVEAFYLNGQCYPAEGVPSLLPLARSIARASGCALNCYAVPEPEDEAWAWNDVVGEIEQRKRDTPEAQMPNFPAANWGHYFLFLMTLRNKLNHIFIPLGS